MDMTDDRAHVGPGAPRPHDHESRLEAARLLGRLKARARAMVMGGATVELSAIGAAMRPYWTERNLSGVYVHETAEGWYAEIEFRNVPEGLTPIMGTPTHRPCASKAEALEQAQGWLAMVIAAEAGDLEGHGTPLPGEGERAFQLDGLMIRLNARVINVAIRAATIARVSPGCAEARLHLLLATDFPAGITEAGWSALHLNRRRLYLGWIGLLLAHGQTRFFRKAPSMGLSRWFSASEDVEPDADAWAPWA